MRLALLTTLAMIAFAANSLLNRAAIAGGEIDSISFVWVRLLAGAAMLSVLSLLLRGRLHLGGEGRWMGVTTLLVYIFGFSAAYDALDAGLGALILFGVVQITMFAGGLLAGEITPPRRWIGAGLAFAGLAWMLWPGAGPRVSVAHGSMMAAAGLGWGLYSLAGQRSEDALQATTANFIIAAPIGLAAGLMFGLTTGSSVVISGPGVMLAALSGAVTSGLGYALWYSVLPRLAGSVAAVAQLTVPVIAVLGGVIFLDEAVTLQVALAAGLVLGGVGISVLQPRRIS